MDEQIDDYDEVLKDMIRVFHNRQKTEQQMYFEKKYFDYLPNEVIESEDSTSDDITYESINPSSGGGSPSIDDEEDSVGVKRRAKRDIENVEQAGRNKRQVWYSVPLYYHSPLPNLHFYYPFDLFSDISDPLPALPSRTYNNNPWSPQNNPSLRFYPPGNFYLPPSQSTPQPSPPTPPPTYLPPSPTNRPPVK